MTNDLRDELSCLAVELAAARRVREEEDRTLEEAVQRALMHLESELAGLGPASQPIHLSELLDGRHDQDVRRGEHHDVAEALDVEERSAPSFPGDEVGDP